MLNKISVAIATYNGEKYIEKQLNSIINQSLLVDEIIIVDDNSNDHTTDIIKSFKAKNNKIKLIKNTINLGHIPSFKLAIQSCKYDFVLLCDQDDIWNFEKVEISYKEIIKFSDTNKPIIIFSDLLVIDNFDRIIFKSFWDYHNFKISDLTFKKALFFNVVTGCTIMMNKFMKDQILLMPENILMHDHWIYMIALSLGNFFYIDKPLVKYRSHNNTVTTKNRISMLQKISNILNSNYRKNYLIENINQAILFKKIYQDQLNEKNINELNYFINIKNKPFFQKKLYVFFNKLF